MDNYKDHSMSMDFAIFILDNYQNRYFLNVTYLITLLKECNFDFKLLQYHLTSLFSKFSNLSPDQIFKLSYDFCSSINSIFIFKHIGADLSVNIIEPRNFAPDCY